MRELRSDAVVDLLEQTSYVVLDGENEKMGNICGNDNVIIFCVHLHNCPSLFPKHYI